MTIQAISAISNIPALSSTRSAASSTGGSSGTDFASALSKGLDSVQAAQSNADSLAVQASTGDLSDISSYTIAATQASLMTQLVSTVRDKAVDSFNEIMGMQA
jgi:flagellar hook-basal body complex protein FliE